MFRWLRSLHRPLLTLALVALAVIGVVAVAAAQDSAGFPTQALTKEAMQSIAGQAVAIFIVVSGLKGILGTLVEGKTTQALAVLLGIGFQVGFVAKGGGFDAYSLAAINGFIAAYLSMKGADVKKANGAPPPEVKPKQ